MKKPFLLFVISAVIQIVSPIFYYFHLSSQLNYEYENGMRTSTNGDSIAIPIVGMFILVFFVLVVINISYACHLFLVHNSDANQE